MYIPYIYIYYWWKMDKKINIMLLLHQNENTVVSFGNVWTMFLSSNNQLLNK